MTAIPMELTVHLPNDANGLSGKSKMAASKLQNMYFSVNKQNETPKAIPIYNYTMKIVAMFYDQTGRNRKWKSQDCDL